MSFTLQELRDAIDRRLSTEIDAPTWSETMKDEGARQALLAYSLRGPVYEEEVEVTEAGHEQELGALDGLLALEEVAWPWQEGAALEQRAVRWRIVMPPGRIRIDGGAPAAGDLLRVRFRRSHAVEGLDGAAATTVPDAHFGAIVAGAALYTALLRTRQIGENPALPQDAATQLRHWCAQADREFAAQLDALGRGRPAPAWAEVGL